jgi:hypothetical protein
LGRVFLESAYIASGVVQQTVMQAILSHCLLARARRRGA